LVLQASPNNLTITDVNGNTYDGTMSYAFTGDASGHNTVNVSYQASGNNLPDYLANATNFQTLDFNYNGTNYYASVNLNLNLINSGFVNFVLDNSGFDNSFTFTNAVNDDNFVVQSTINSLTVTDATGNTSLNLIMDGGVNVGAYYNHALTFNGQTVNIDSTGSIGNSISGIDFSNNALTTAMTLNFTGSQSLTIGGYDYGYYGINLNDGSTLSVNDNSTAKLTIYAGDNSSSSNPTGVTLNFYGSSAPIDIYDISSSNNTPDNIILGSGSATVNTDNGNYVITVGSGSDNIVTYANINVFSVTSTNYSGFIATLNGNINSNDSITFTNQIPSSYSINQNFAYIDESSATSQNQAIANALNTLNNDNSRIAGDYAAYFNYEGNTYIINEMLNGAPYNQVVKLTGTVNLSNVTISGHTISNL
jgi:hypothetical protein